MKYRCPYCGEKGLSVIEHCGVWVSTRGYAAKYAGRFRCTECSRTAELLYGKTGAFVGVGLSYFVPCAVALYLVIKSSLDKNPDTAVFGIPLMLLIVFLFNLLFAHFDKRTAQERDADARLTFAVTAEGARVKKWEIYLLRFPKRGTNAYSPVIYAMVCGKSGKKGERVLTLRVIRADNMDLPDVGEAALLVTRTNKVVEGTVTSVTPKKELYLPDE